MSFACVLRRRVVMWLMACAVVARAFLVPLQPMRRGGVVGPQLDHHQRKRSVVVHTLSDTTENNEAADDDDDDDDDDLEPGPLDMFPGIIQRSIVDAIVNAGSSGDEEGKGPKVFMIHATGTTDEEEDNRKNTTDGGEKPIVAWQRAVVRVPPEDSKSYDEFRGALRDSAKLKFLREEYKRSNNNNNNNNEAPPRKKRVDPLERISTFDLRPREVREHLDRFVVRQDEAKKVLSVAICDHYNVVRRCVADEREREADYSKPNILLLGPSGSGKTYVIRTLAKLLGVPFVKADATKFTETGIVGEDAEDLVRQLVDQANGDTTLAQYGIIYVDEVDKLCRDSSAGGLSFSSGVSSRGVQSTFLKVMEETDVSVSKGFGIPEIIFGGGGAKAQGPRRISTKHILFIFSGAFTGLDAKLRKDREHRSIGFGAVNNNKMFSDDDDDDDNSLSSLRSYLSEATSADFVAAGLEPEFVGRIPVRVAVEPLDAKALEQILRTSEGSALKQYERDFEGYGVDLSVDDSFIAAVAREAAAEKTGARGLVTVLERTFRDFKYELPCAGIDRLKATGKTVADPRSALDEILKKATLENADEVRRRDAARFCDHLAAKLDLNTVRFEDEAVDWLVAKSRSDGLALRTLCKQLFGLYDRDKNNIILKAIKASVKTNNQTDLVLPLKFFTDRTTVLRAWFGEAQEDDDEDEDEDEDSPPKREEGEGRPVAQ
ncbi:hypothetical protein CTAYLR_004175 [Chrysophaeum taylorii]|uniref:AAA+ ATPase domain-containing protein n=1 Tax=Chrysophaeum taylorii TaxID=2483200 RepID=A0AAD7UMS2_9STRA|nr:hypothetical protein CTAYLR_004175 [Chrysophaeum taylorii]